MTRTLFPVLLASMCLAASLAGCTESCDCAALVWLDVTVVDAFDAGKSPPRG